MKYPCSKDFQMKRYSINNRRSDCLIREKFINEAIVERITPKWQSKHANGFQSIGKAIPNESYLQAVNEINQMLKIMMQTLRRNLRGGISINPSRISGVSSNCCKHYRYFSGVCQ